MLGWAEYLVAGDNAGYLDDDDEYFDQDDDNHHDAGHCYHDHDQDYDVGDDQFVD